MGAGAADYAFGKSDLRALDDEVMRRKWVWLCLAGGLLVIPLGLAVQEVVIFSTSNETSARILVNQEFLDECARRGLDPTEFKGPLRIKSPERTYGYVWTNPSSGDQIATMVRYFPAGVESWLIRGKEHETFAPYCDDRASVC